MVMFMCLFLVPLRIARGRGPALVRRPHPVRDLAQNLADLRAQVAANARGAPSWHAWSPSSASRWSRAYMQHVQDNAEEAVRRVIDRLGRRRAFARRWTTAASSPCRVTVGPRGAQRHGRLHRHLAAAGRQLQRAGGRVHGGRALRLPHAGGRRHPAQRRLPQAAAHRGAAGLHARPGLPRRGRGRQRGDVAGHHRRPVRRPRRGRGVAGHDEQPHVRRRPLPVLRDASAAAPAPGPAGTAAAPCTRT